MNQQSTKLASLSLALVVLLSVFAGSFAFAGTAAAANASDYEFDEKLEDGKTYWQGQTLFRNVSTSNGGETYEVHGADDANSGYFQQVRATSDGALLVESKDMPEGNFYLEDENNTLVANFTVAKQSFSVSTSDADSSDTTYTFDFASNRVGFDVIVESDGLNATALESIFNAPAENVTNADGDSDNEYVVKNVDDGDAIDATFTEEQAGEYNFTFTVRDTGVADSVNNFAVAQPSDATASFSETLYSEEEGDVASFNVSLNGTDRAEVRFGDSDIGYQYNVTVVDGNGDGVVTVEFNSLNAGNGNNDTVTAAHAKDSINPLNAETNISDAPLDTGTYDLSVLVNGEEKDLASLVLTERSTEGVSTHLVPGAEKTNSVEDISASAVSGDTVALGDKLVVKFDASGVFASLDGKTASDLAVGTDGITVEVTELNPGINQEPASLDVSNASLRQDAENNAFYLVFDTDNYPSLEDGDKYEVHLNFSEANPYMDDAEEAESQDVKTTFAVSERTAEFDAYDKMDDVVYVNPQAEYALSGTSTAAPGTELTVFARAEGDAPFLYQKDVVVQNDGTFSATFDFSALSEGDEFTVAVRGFGEETAQVVKAGPDKFNLSVKTVDENGEAVESNVKVNGEAYDGKALTNGTYTVTASAEGHSDASKQVTIDGQDASVTLTLGPAKHDLTVSVVDENGEPVSAASVSVDGEPLSDSSVALEDGTYVVEANADGFKTASKEVTVEGASKSVTLTLTAKQTTTQTPTPTTEEPTTTAAPTTENPGQPGFGVVVALVAMLGAALLATRRQD